MVELSYICQLSKEKKGKQSKLGKESKRKPESERNTIYYLHRRFSSTSLEVWEFKFNWYISLLLEKKDEKR